MKLQNRDKPWGYKVVFETGPGKKSSQSRNFLSYPPVSEAEKMTCGMIDRLKIPQTL